VFGPLQGDTPWWIAGGYAIELFVGRHLRHHGDIDVLLLRRDQHFVHEVLIGWDIHAADPPGRLRRWEAGEVLPEHVHDIWCRENPSAPWRVQIMFDRAVGALWVSRRDPQVRRAVADMGRASAQGWPYLAPEIQLFYKAKPSNQPEKDEVDFAAAVPLMDPAQQGWLDNALKLTLPDHPWRRALQR
jgi:hypothetical protein